MTHKEFPTKGDVNQRMHQFRRWLKLNYSERTAMDYARALPNLMQRVESTQSPQMQGVLKRSRHFEKTWRTFLKFWNESSEHIPTLPEMKKYIGRYQSWMEKDLKRSAKTAINRRGGFESLIRRLDAGKSLPDVLQQSKYCYYAWHGQTGFLRFWEEMQKGHQRQSTPQQQTAEHSKKVQPQTHPPYELKREPTLSVVKELHSQLHSLREWKAQQEKEQSDWRDAAGVVWKRLNPQTPFPEDPVTFATKLVAVTNTLRGILNQIFPLVGLKPNISDVTFIDLFRVIRAQLQNQFIQSDKASDDASTLPKELIPQIITARWQETSLGTDRSKLNELLAKLLPYA